MEQELPDIQLLPWIRCPTCNLPIGLYYERYNKRVSEGTMSKEAILNTLCLNDENYELIFPVFNEAYNAYAIGVRELVERYGRNVVFQAMTVPEYKIRGYTTGPENKKIGPNVRVKGDPKVNKVYNALLDLLDDVGLTPGDTTMVALAHTKGKPLGLPSCKFFKHWFREKVGLVDPCCRINIQYPITMPSSIEEEDIMSGRTLPTITMKEELTPEVLRELAKEYGESFPSFEPSPSQQQLQALEQRWWESTPLGEYPLLVMGNKPERPEKSALYSEELPPIPEPGEPRARARKGMYVPLPPVAYSVYKMVLTPEQLDRLVMLLMVPEDIYSKHEKDYSGEAAVPDTGNVYSLAGDRSFVPVPTEAYSFYQKVLSSEDLHRLKEELYVPEDIYLEFPYSASQGLLKENIYAGYPYSIYAGKKKTPQGLVPGTRERVYFAH